MRKKEKPLSEAMIRDRYWMAYFYGVNPNEFLNQPVSSIRQHIKQSKVLYRRMMKERKQVAMEAHR